MIFVRMQITHLSIFGKYVTIVTRPKLWLLNVGKSRTQKFNKFNGTKITYIKQWITYRTNAIITYNDCPNSSVEDFSETPSKNHSKIDEYINNLDSKTPRSDFSKTCMEKI